MESFFINKVLLLPYYLVLKLRHYLYDTGFFKSYKFDIPIIIVGNISAGGTGKTPHTEYIVKHLLGKGPVAVLSRGYGRKSKGFRYVNIDDTALMSGDEPLQIKHKFPNAIVAVDANRVRAIKILMALPAQQRPSVIVMDDAFQHRRVVASTNIVLVDYSRPIGSDNLLPIGSLRDLPEQMVRADIVIVTKCPLEMSQGEQFAWKRSLKLAPTQNLFFSAMKYSEPEAIFPEGDKRYIYSNFAQLVTAIANPKPLEYELLSKYKIIKKLKYRDHKNFSKRDIASINNLAKSSPKAVIFTTEKDAKRLVQLNNLTSNVKLRIFYLPIEVTILNESDSSFLNLLE